jgi:hypothetical protein
MKNLGWYLIIFVIALSVISGVVGKNKALNQLLDECRDKDATHVDLILDLQQENAKLMDYIHNVEAENAILGSCCANGGLQADTIILN